jgi:hypothetical protein
MTYITTAYMHSSHDNQEFRGEPVHNGLTVEQTNFLARFETELDEINQDRLLLCTAFLLKQFDANEFLNTLAEHRLAGSREQFAKAYATGVIELAAKQAAAESPPAPPTAQKPHRAASPAQELLDAVAGARISRRVA